MDSSSSVSTSSSEPRSPISTPRTTPPASPTGGRLVFERPGPGSFKYMPVHTPWFWCSQKEAGVPGGHPVLILPCEGLDPTLVLVVFTTTKDVVGYTNAKSWACNYVPLEGQLHPWRDAIPLAQGCATLPKPTSINVSTRYLVDWRYLEDVNVTSPGMLAPCLSAEVLYKLTEYVAYPRADIKVPYRIREPQLGAKAREEARANAMAVISSPPAPVSAPVSALLPFRLADGTPFNPWLLAGTLVAQRLKTQKMRCQSWRRIE